MNALKSGAIVGSVAAIGLTFALGMRLGESSVQAGSSLIGSPVIDLTPHRGVIVEGEAGTRGRLSVACPSGTVIGGGFSHVGKDIQVIESRPDGIYAWQVSWVQLAADDSVLYVYASCLIS